MPMTLAEAEAEVFRLISGQVANNPGLNARSLVRIVSQGALYLQIKIRTGQVEMGELLSLAAACVQLSRELLVMSGKSIEELKESPDRIDLSPEVSALPDQANTLN